MSVVLRNTCFSTQAASTQTEVSSKMQAQTVINCAWYLDIQKFRNHFSLAACKGTKGSNNPKPNSSAIVCNNCCVCLSGHFFVLATAKAKFYQATSLTLQHSLGHGGRNGAFCGWSRSWGSVPGASILKSPGQHSRHAYLFRVEF